MRVCLREGRGQAAQGAHFLEALPPPVGQPVVLSLLPLELVQLLLRATHILFYRRQLVGAVVHQSLRHVNEEDAARLVPLDNVGPSRGVRVGVRAEERLLGEQPTLPEKLQHAAAAGIAHLLLLNTGRKHLGDARAIRALLCQSGGDLGVHSPQGLLVRALGEDPALDEPICTAWPIIVCVCVCVCARACACVCVHGMCMCMCVRAWQKRLGMGARLRLTDGLREGDVNG